MNSNKLKFVKMHGCGNDYIYIDCFDQIVDDPQSLSIRLSRYHTGIGGDGIILICPSDVADAKMRIFNQDGSEGKMCGNGIRCVGKYLYDSGHFPQKTLRIETLSGIKTLSLSIKDNKTDTVTVDMGQAELAPEKIPVALPGNTVLNKPVSIGGKEWNITCVSMGNPHCVIFCPDIGHMDIQTIGSQFEHNPIFPEGVNTEFVEIVDQHTLKMRVWERGSGETQACGTGACASAAAAVRNGFCPADETITVKLLGGDLQIRYTPETVWMTGEAVTVFSGELELSN